MIRVDIKPELLSWARERAGLEAGALAHRFPKLAAKLRDAEADVRAMERDIDHLVYALYGLTPEETQIVEESAQKK